MQFSFPRPLHFAVCLFVSSFVSSLLAQTSAVQPRIVQPVNESVRTVLKGNTHPLARPQSDRGAAPADLPMKRMLLVLKRSPEQESALRQLLDDQQDKASAAYHKWLTPEQFGLQFGPGDQDMATVASWLRGHGFEIGNVAKGRNIIEFSGTAGQVQEAFHTSIHKYVVNGESHWANSKDPEIPTALTPVVAGIHTLHNFLKKPMMKRLQQKVPAKLVTGKDGKPLVNFTEPPTVHAIGPADFATIYNVNPLYKATPPIDGSGVTIAVVGRTDLFFYQQDFVSFRQIFGLPYQNLGLLYNGPRPGDLGAGERFEAILDVSWSGAAAPGANIDFVASASTNDTDGVDLSEAFIIDNNLASIMTESFGSCEAGYTQTEADGFSTLAEQAAAQGITYLVASGDSGAEGCDNPNLETVATGPLSVNILSSTPFNLAVGGTMFNENNQDSQYWSSQNGNTFGSAIKYIPEKVWNESCTEAQCGKSAGIWAAGGGASTFFGKPSWQAGVKGIPNDSARDVPDVSLTAAGHDPYVICFDNSCVPDPQGLIYLYFVGGTSASTPSFAGVMALVDQKMGGPQGQAAYTLYKLAAQEDFSKCNGSNTSNPPASTCVFNDTTSGNNAVPGEANYGNSNAKYQSSVGFDLATGLGSVNVANLVDKWNTVSFKATTTSIADLNPLSITHGQPVNLTLNVTASGGTPTGDVSLITSNNQGVGEFPLNGGTASPTLNSLPGGTYTITARYAGDGTFAASTSAPSDQITVNPEASSTTLTAQTLDKNFNPIPFTTEPYGTYLFLQSSVAGTSGQGMPTGGVQFSDDQHSIDTYEPLNNLGFTNTPNYLGSLIGSSPIGIFNLQVGQRTLNADYLGDLGFSASTSSPISVTVTQAPTTIIVTPAGDTQGAYLSALINTNSGGRSPDGTVTFYVNGNSVGDVTMGPYGGGYVGQDGNLVGVQSATDYFNAPLANGSYKIKAVYNGDQNYLSSTSAEVDFKVQPDFTFQSNMTSMQLVPGKSGQITFSLSALDGFTGSVTFDSSSCSGLPTGASCSFSPASVKGSGSTTLTLSTTGLSAALPHQGSSPWWISFSSFGLAAFVLIGVPARNWRSNLAVLSLICILLLASLGCGGGSSSSSQQQPPAPPANPTPAGTYPVTVKAASGSLSHTVIITLTVT